MLQLQRNVPRPRRRIKADDGRKKYPFEKMTKVGDFFFVPGKKRDSIRTYFSTAGRSYGITLKSEQIYARQVKGKWEPCEASDPGATDGVGVWRV